MITRGGVCSLWELGGSDFDLFLGDGQGEEVVPIREFLPAKEHGSPLGVRY